MSKSSYQRPKTDYIIVNKCISQQLNFSQFKYIRNNQRRYAY